MNHATDAPTSEPQHHKQPSTEAKARNGSWGSLSTEARNPASEKLDMLSCDEVVALLLEEDRRGVEAVARCQAEIASAAGWVAETLKGGGSVLLAGAGTSGRLGILEAAECPPTFGTDPHLIRAVIAGGQDAVFKAREGAEDIFEDGAAAAQDLGRGDLLIALSASSATRYVLGALDAARSNGARTVLITCTPPGRITSVADMVLALDTGPEVLTGSTRLKAGSATKAALNAITTAAMVRLGKVYGNLMVDLRPGSAKLQDRALRIIAAAGDVSVEQAATLHEAAGGEVKTAIVMAVCGIDAEPARERLRAAGGHVRAALEGTAEPDRNGATNCEE